MPAGRCDMTVFQKKLWTGLVVMALLSPIGIFLPNFFNAEDAWGEWSAEKLKELIGYVPAGLEKLADLWKAPIPDYNPGGEGASMAAQAVWYVVSGLIGILLVAGAVYLLARLLQRHEK
ncbi:MAG: cobalamin biosynthesis protein [Nitrospirae bacterium]|nr:MAG: cobalamin biosynthesis protein [Nitrospirota bacterium]